MSSTNKENSPHSVDEFETEDEELSLSQEEEEEVTTNNEINTTVTNRRSSLGHYPITTTASGSGFGYAFEPINTSHSNPTSTFNSPSTTRSPIKSPNSNVKSLPPIPPGSTLKISKRRKLEPISSSPFSIDKDTSSRPPSFESTITPIKQRSISTPLRSIGRRTPSLQDKPIPVLSPPTTYEEEPTSDKLLEVEAAGEEESKNVDKNAVAETPSSSSSSSSPFVYANKNKIGPSPFESSPPPTIKNRSVTTPAVIMSKPNTNSNTSE